MMLIVVFLQLVEVASLVLSCIDMVQGIVANIVKAIPNLKESPEERSKDRALKFDNLANSKVPQCEDDHIHKRR